MKKLIPILIIVLILLFPSGAYAYLMDYVYFNDGMVQVLFKKFIWKCPVCGLGDILDAYMGGGNTYVHTCNNGHTFNQSAGNMTEYNGSLRYPQEEYDILTPEALAEDKQEKLDAWLYERANQPPYVPPDVEDGSNVVPEPSSLLLMGLGGIIAAFIKRRRKA